MQVAVVAHTRDRLTIRLEIPIGPAFGDSEDAIRAALNEAGRLATAAALEASDADGAPMERGGSRLSSKGRILKLYETPYGQVPLQRHVYQGPRGGATFSPLDEAAGILGGATPAFARLVASKYADAGAAGVQLDLERNHGRPASKAMIESLAAAVAARARMEAEATRPDPPPGPERTIARVVALLDARPPGGVPDLPPARIAAVELYDRQDRLQHVTHLARLAEHGGEEAAFLDDVGRALRRVARDHPEAEVLGISGGQPEFVRFLRDVAVRQVLDPDRLREALAAAVPPAPRPDAGRPGTDAPASPAEIRDWLAGVDRELREDPGRAPDRAIGQLREWAASSGDAAAAAGVADRIGRWREAGLLDYGPGLPALVFDRPGPLAGLADALLGDRFRHVRLRMGIGRARAILLLRELTRTRGRWEAFVAAMAGRWGQGPRG